MKSNGSWLGRLLVAVVLMLVVASLAGCGVTRIGPGHVGLEVSMAGSNRGVSDIPVRTGWLWYQPLATQVYEYPTYVQTAKWTKADEGNPTNEELSFKSKEGVIVTLDLSLSYQLAADKAAHFFVKYRTDDLQGFTHGILRNMARDAFNEIGGTYGVDDLTGPKLGQFLTEVREKVNQQVASEGIHIEQFGVLESPRLPGEYQAAIMAKQQAVQQAQRAENELRTTTAEAAKRVAAAEGDAKARVAQADGEATANKVLAASITSQLLELRKLDIQQQAIQRWKGDVPSIQGGSGTGGGGLTIVVPLKQQ
jgi:regulator of protease activity HflC (stomatin/prohibitin superfamily)